MTDTPPKPKRRSWQWIAIIVFVGTIVGLQVRYQLKNAELETWLARANKRDLLVSSETVGAIPPLEDTWLGKSFVGRCRVTVFVDFPTEVAALMELPDCPADFRVFIGPSLPDASANLLRERFGNAVTGPALNP